MKETTISYINFILGQIENDSTAENREKRCDMAEGSVLMALTLDLIDMNEMLSYCSRIQKLREKAPAADVVEVVRCKDCVCGRHPNKSDRFEALYPMEYLYCCVHECGVKKDGYCSYGKRKGQK